MIANWAVCFFTSVGVPTVPSLDFSRICLNWSGLHSSHYSVTPKVLPNYRMANDLPNFGNRSTEKTLFCPSFLLHFSHFL